MPAVARIGDPIDCGDVICEGSGDVFVEGIPVTRAELDNTCGHCFNPTTITPTTTNVFVNDKKIALVDDAIVPHTCGPSTHGGNVASGASSVYANEALAS